ncbi:LPP20 family lipoprotein [Barnesiella sp. An55]|uniref:LPP20 family lipoprotein n=1 Tax=Barnesiella sp. An55 TaxID=1965646 RepID=UPI000B55D36B|nr:LPP20 family lipoprotein [Barnesiella sp. An55]OUN69742.1 hypothetical protein B5G10_11175 [Barnesiella sp. An55]HIZ25574.1 LPP20 family lipoprotein [Candidatus Barnesiella merdipullorum]
MKAIKLLLISLGVISLASCSSTKQAANSGEQEVEQLCHFLTSEEYFYANATAESTDMQMAKDKAVNSARASIASSISTAVENFSKRYRNDINTELNEKTEERLQLITKQTLSGSTIVCDRIVRTADGKYRAYISVGLSKTEITDAIEKAILEDEKLKLDYQQAQFDKVADETIAKSGVQ